MSTKTCKIYVGNLPWDTTDEELSQLFSTHGRVLDAKVVMDRATGRSRGFGFVTMESGDGMSEAIKTLNGFSMKGRALVVNEARDRDQAPPSGGGGFRRSGGGGGGGGGGGYGGGSDSNSGGGGYYNRPDRDSNSGGGGSYGGRSDSNGGGRGGFGASSRRARQFGRQDDF